METRQQKEQLRSQLLTARKGIAASDFKKASKKIIETLKKQQVFRQAETVHCYVSMNERREVDTHALIRDLLSSGKKVVVPVTNFCEGTLRHVGLQTFSELESNKWGVLEPREGDKVPLSEIDLVIVPMVAADEQCNRLGYGEGFYDRFLKDIAAVKAGLIFEQNVVKELPTESFDVPLDRIVTEKRVICRGGD